MTRDKAMGDKMRENKVMKDKPAGDKVMGDTMVGDKMMRNKNCNQDDTRRWERKQGETKEIKENMAGDKDEGRRAGPKQGVRRQNDGWQGAATNEMAIERNSWETKWK